MTLNYLIIGKNLRAARQKKMMSQAELAEITDLSTGYISLVESGTRSVGLVAFIKLANALEVSADSLFAENLIYVRNNANTDELLDVLQGCNAYERRIILDVAREVKRALRDNRYLKPKAPTP